MPRLRINRAVPLLPYTPSCCGMHVFTFTCLIIDMSVDCFEVTEVTDSYLNCCLATDCFESPPSRGHYRLAEFGSRVNLIAHPLCLEPYPTNAANNHVRKDNVQKHNGVKVD